MYIGSTVFPCKKRILEHRRAILHNDPSYPVARHFNETHKNNLDNLAFFAFDRITGSARGGDREKDTMTAGITLHNKDWNQNSSRLEAG